MQTNYMVKATLYGLIEKHIKDNGLNLKCMVKGNCNFQMEENIKGYYKINKIRDTLKIRSMD